MTLLWLDDIRDPNDQEVDWMVFSPIGRDVDIVWVKNYDQFCNHIRFNGLPDGICFDHDLGEDESLSRVSRGMNKKVSRRLKKESKSGFDCAKFLVDYCLDRNLSIPPYNIQSANPVGKENINGLLKSYERFFLK